MPSRERFYDGEGRGQSVPVLPVLPDPAELKMMMKRTSSSLRKNVGGIAMKWANDPELPEDFRELMLHAARESEAVTAKPASRRNLSRPGRK